jgi:PE family
MSFVTVAPEFVGQAAADLEGIGSALRSANAAATTPTTGVIAPGADEVSLAITALLATHARQYQALSAQAATFHSQFVSMLNAGAGSYVGTEVANAKNNLLNAVNAPVQELLGHPSAVTAGRLAAALEAAEPELANGESELIMAGRTALAGVAELQPAVANLVHAGGAFISAGTDAVAGLTDLESSAAQLVQGVDDFVMAGGSAASGLGLLGSAVGELFNPATIALAVPSALRGLDLLGTAAVELASGVHDLTLVGQDAVAGIAALQSASAEFAQGVSDAMLAGQDAATGLAALQSAGAEFVQSVSDVKMAADAAAAALGF